jgi:AraC family transcriptional regulator
MNYKVIDYKKRIYAVMNYISQNIEKNLSLEDIAEFAGFSMFHFHRIFKAVVGETVAEFTRRLRLELAANRLISKQFDDITTIAIESGFSSSQNFAKVFRKYFNVTPTEYRNSKIGNKESKKENDFSFREMYNSNDEHKKIIKKVMKAEVKEIPSYKVAYVRKIGSYNKETCQPAFRQITQWAEPRNFLDAEKVIAIYWDNPEVTSSEKCRFDACVIIPDNFLPERDIFTQNLYGGFYAVCNFEIKPEFIQSAWEESYKWVCESGFECNDTPCYEVYHNHISLHPEGKWVLDICIPLNL